ncbi:MAG: hypothetical protein MUP16_02060 [Sedimentisphaerales bacterium]|nr:hypothetical protein [Sedimentisphaerales bacterium]
MIEDRRKGVRAGYERLGPTARFLFRIAIFSVLLTVIGYILGLLSSEYYYARSQRAARHLANVTMSRPVPFVLKFPVIIEDGGNIQEMPTPGRYRPAISRCPFSFFITQDGSINLRGVIRDAEGNIVTEGTGDSIRVIQANKYDINSDAKAIEVVDANQRPVFQLMVIPYEDFITEKAQRRSKHSAAMRQRMEAAGIPDVNMFLARNEQQIEEKLKEKKIEEVIRLSYITQQGETWWISSPDGSISVKSLEEDEWSLIPRLFCYPGYSHPGKRVAQ